jgi:hypothetical protein
VAEETLGDLGLQDGPGRQTDGNTPSGLLVVGALAYLVGARTVNAEYAKANRAA